MTRSDVVGDSARCVSTVVRRLTGETRTRPNCRQDHDSTRSAACPRRLFARRLCCPPAPTQHEIRPHHRLCSLSLTSIPSDLQDFKTSSMEWSVMKHKSSLPGCTVPALGSNSFPDWWRLSFWLPKRRACLHQGHQHLEKHRLQRAKSRTD